jgi:peptidoglycan/xylan/chitin deacetylase (PgdA/CDA1 family)
VSIIWRDDDIGKRTKVDVLGAVNDIFQRYGTPHTIAIMAAGLDERPDLVDLIVERGMIVQLHCWDHEDLTRPEHRADLPRALDMAERLFGKRPTVLYPPWNRTDAELDAFAARLGLTVSTVKLSLEQYIRARGDVDEDVVNFHHWHVPEAVLLEQALRIAAAR